MFDERSDKWIKIFKGYTVVMFWLYMIAGIVLGILCLSGELELIDRGSEGAEVVGFIICLVGGFFLAYAKLVVNMLIIQFLNNVQIIRKKM